jgi:hypothetical protein
MVNLFGGRLAGASASTKEELFAFTADPPLFDFRCDNGLRREANEVN